MANFPIEIRVKLTYNDQETKKRFLLELVHAIYKAQIKNCIPGYHRRCGAYSASGFPRGRQAAGGKPPPYPYKKRSAPVFRSGSCYVMLLCYTMAAVMMAIL